jgi:hypothetical protein
MTQGRMSPLMLMAGQGLMQNTGLGINTDMLANISAYEALPPVNTYQTALANANATAAMNTFANSSCPALTHAVPNGSTRLNDLITSHSNNILGNGDLTKFAVQMFASLSYVSTAGEMIDNVVTANSYLGDTFDGFDSLITGSISNISLAFDEFGTDLVNTGYIINFERLQHYGTPHGLVETLNDLSILDFVSPELVQQGINPEAIKLKLLNLNSTEQLAPVVQKKCYEAFKLVTDEKLQVIKDILRITNTEVVTLADVLNTFKMFPTSRQTLNGVTKNGYRAIYVNTSGSVSEHFKNQGSKYYSIMPADICDANAAFKNSLQQVKNISEMNAIGLGTIITQLESNYGLDDINLLAQPLPADTYSYYTTTFATGSGDNGRFYLSDFIGTPAGIVHKDAYSLAKSTLVYLDDQGALTDINAAFVVLNNVLNDVYGTPDGSTVGTITIPSGNAGAGAYATYSDAVDAVLSNADTLIQRLTDAYPEEVDSLNAQFAAMNTQITNEQTNLALAGVVFADTPNSPNSMMNLVSNLHSYAVQNDYRGVAEMLEKMADLTTRAGQALVGALREGRNLSILSNTGISTDSLPQELTQPTDSAELSTAKYSLTEAENSTIID